MCKVRSKLKEMVKMRLDAAAEEIFELFERIIVEYEEELRRVTERRATETLPQDLPRVVQQPSVSREAFSDVSDPVDLVIKQEPVDLPEDDHDQLTITSYPLKSETQDEGDALSPNDSDQPRDLSQGGSGGPSVQTIDLTLGESLARKKPHACPYCGKCYSWKSHLEIHQRVHTGEKPFGCTFCGKRFTKKMYLVIHLRRHTGEKPYSCSICEDRFISRDSVVKHMTVVHSNLCNVGKPPKHRCAECGKVFASRSHLEMHVRVHTGEKPFECSECGKRFTQKATMLGHMTRHTGERPYSCPICQRGFRQKNHVQKHMNIHFRQFTVSQDPQPAPAPALFMYPHQDLHPEFREPPRDFAQAPMFNFGS